jgi:hypothetical protein
MRRIITAPNRFAVVSWPAMAICHGGDDDVVEVKITGLI